MRSTHRDTTDGLNASGAPFTSSSTQSLNSKECVIGEGEEGDSIEVEDASSPTDASTCSILTVGVTEAEAEEEDADFFMAEAVKVMTSSTSIPVLSALFFLAVEGSPPPPECPSSATFFASLPRGVIDCALRQGVWSSG